MEKCGESLRGCCDAVVAYQDSNHCVPASPHFWWTPMVACLYFRDHPWQAPICGFQRPNACGGNCPSAILPSQEFTTLDFRLPLAEESILWLYISPTPASPCRIGSLDSNGFVWAPVSCEQASSLAALLRNSQNHDNSKLLKTRAILMIESFKCVLFLQSLYRLRHQVPHWILIFVTLCNNRKSFVLVAPSPAT